MITQQTFVYSKSAIETLEKVVKTCSELTIKTPEQRHWRRFGVFIVNFEHISQFLLVFLLLTWSMYLFVVMLSQENQVTVMIQNDFRKTILTFW